MVKHKTEDEKVFERVKNQQKIIEAMKYHHEPGKDQLEKTKAAGGYAESNDEGLNEDLHSKVGQKITDLRQGLHSSKERARRRGQKVFAMAR